MTTALNLTNYQGLQQATFIRLVFTENGSQIVVRLSNHSTPFSLVESDGNTYSYPAVGTLLGVTQITNELKSSQTDVTISLSGIPQQYMSDIVANPIKAAPVEIRKVFFNTTGDYLNIPGNPVLEFVGVVSNFSIDEKWTNYSTQSVTSTINLTCASTLAVLSKQEAGRRTNQADQNYWFPGDNAMNRVASLTDAVWDFGGTSPVSTINPTTGLVVQA
jgi:hypothetical protein